MAQEGVYVFPDAASNRVGNSIDPGLLALLNQNGGFGGNGNWIWILFLWMIWGGNGNGFGNGFNNGTGFLANQANQEAGTNLIIQALNGRADALGQLAQITNNSTEAIKTILANMQTAIQTSGLQTINSVQLGNANLAQQICECCCNMRYDLAQQTNALQAQAANNFASTQLQSAQNHAATQLQLAQQEAADQLGVCQQTNTLTRQADGNTNSILTAIQNQNTMITKEFCDIKEREMQDKINTQGDIITQLRNQISNDRQTLQFNAAFQALDNKVDAIAAKQPNTVPVQWPNLTAVNNTPNIGQNYYPGYGYGWGNGFGGGIVL